MKVHSIEGSRIVYLVHVTRDRGQLFLPKALAALVAKFNFQVFPTPEQLTGDVFTFKMGEFNDAAIDEFSIHTDGFVVSSKSNSKLLDAFVDELFGWVAAALGVKRTEVPPHEKHYESYLIVSLRETKYLAPGLSRTEKFLRERQEAYGLKPFSFAFGGFSLLTDATQYGSGRKPIAFTLARRINVSFEDNVYYSSAPLQTDDHVAVLEQIEKELG